MNIITASLVNIRYAYIGVICMYIGGVYGCYIHVYLLCIWVLIHVYLLCIWAPLGLFIFISDYLPYFEKINIFFNIITNKKLFIRIHRNFCSVHEVITSIRLYTPLHTLYAGYPVCTTWLRLFPHEPNK